MIYVNMSLPGLIHAGFMQLECDKSAATCYCRLLDLYRAICFHNARKCGRWQIGCAFSRLSTSVLAMCTCLTLLVASLYGAALTCSPKECMCTRLGMLKPPRCRAFTCTLHDDSTLYCDSPHRAFSTMSPVNRSGYPSTRWCQDKDLIRCSVWSLSWSQFML
jgi:hypothetical protein